jgi:hypothetical protein
MVANLVTEASIKYSSGEQQATGPAFMIVQESTIQACVHSGILSCIISSTTLPTSTIVSLWTAEHMTFPKTKNQKI